MHLGGVGGVDGGVHCSPWFGMGVITQPLQHPHPGPGAGPELFVGPGDHHAEHPPAEQHEQQYSCEAGGCKGGGGSGLLAKVHVTSPWWSAHSPEQHSLSVVHE